MTRIRDFQPDGYHLQLIKQHSLEKLELHNYYAEIFAAGMRRLWPNLVYVGLYSGSGAAEVEGTNRIVMTSALSALTQSTPFDRYVFVDHDERCMEALAARVNALGLEGRVELINEDVNASVESVLGAIPDWRTEGGVLTFCFIDPFKVNLDFEVVRRVADLRVDILLMIPLGYDVRRNWRDYVNRPAMRDRLSAFLGGPEWIDEWGSLGRPHSEFPRFVQERVNNAMKDLKFIEIEHRDIKDVKVPGKNVYLYSLHLYSKSDVAIKFWRDALKGTSEQGTLGI